jgi:hypothetical protein
MVSRFDSGEKVSLTLFERQLPEVLEHATGLGVITVVHVVESALLSELKDVTSVALASLHFGAKAGRKRKESV